MDNVSQLPTPQEIVDNALQSLGVKTRHSPESLTETAHWLTNPGLDDPQLTDLTALPFVTIDNPDSRDLDQALLICKSDGSNDAITIESTVEDNSDTGYRVLYALADASYYITPGSALFAEALARGTTYYTPLMAAAMLPVDLSEGLISLNPGVDRRAVVFDMRVDKRGSVTRTDVIRGKIRSQAKLSYESVQRWLDDYSEPVNPYDASLLLLRELGDILIANATQRGVVTFDRTEARIITTGRPERFEARVRERYDTERYNEQISLMCNMQGAELLLGLSGHSDAVQAIFRVHEAPLRKSLNRLRETLDEFAAQQDDPSLWQWQTGQSLADYVDALPDNEDFTRRVKSVQRQIMQAQRASTFTTEAGEHHALKAASYARFSSPMREVVGIFTHKELLEALYGGAADNSTGKDELLRTAVIDAANEARKTQRKLDKAVELAALSSVFAIELAGQSPETRIGTIVDIRKDRLYVSLDEMAVDIKLYKDAIEAQFHTEYDFQSVRIQPKDESSPVWQIGQAVKIVLDDFDTERKRYSFVLSAG